jgi:hypothetical protein
VQESGCQIGSPVRPTGVLLCLAGFSSRRLSRKTHKRVRTAAAWLCLLAVALLYAPLASAALIANGADCCVNGYCNIAEHKHHKQKLAQSQDAAPMDCGHDMSGMGGKADLGVGMKSCSMSCCQDPVRPVLIPGAFLLPGMEAAPTVIEVIRPVEIKNSLEISRFIKPLSPPPRFSSSVL